MARRRRSPRKYLVVAAAFGLAATVVCFGAAHAEPSPRALASELRVVLGDLDRLAQTGLPPRHAEGLAARIEGALGLLPWLLIEAGDGSGAEELAAWQGGAFDTPDDRARLSALIAGLAARHDLALMDRTSVPPPAAALAEAQAIHDTYCFGCHDGYGAGDPDERLPGRDLAQMAREEPGDIFLARLISGVKGDESLAFHNPLTDRQLLALWALYRGAE